MNILNSHNRIIQLMSIFVTQVKGSTAMTRTDINHVAEMILVPLFREVYGYENLKNLNSEEGANYPGVDLGDEIARVAIQVTSTADSEKVKHTLEQFAKHELYKKYDRLIIYILTEKQNSYSGNGFDQIIQNRFQFSKDQDILDYRDVLTQVDTFQVGKAQAVEHILEQNFGGDHTLPRMHEDVLTIQVEQQQIAQDADQARVIQTERIIAAQQATMQQQTQEFGRIQEAMRLLLEVTLQPPSTSPEDIASSAKLDIARDLLKEGQASAARKILLELRNKNIPQVVSLEIKFRTATQLGACAYELDDIDTAVRELSEALTYKPDDLAALTNAATAASLAGNVDEALHLCNRVRQIEKQSSVATSISIGIWHHQGRSEEIDQIIADEPWITTDAMCLATLGDIKFQDGDYATGEKYLLDATKADEKNPLPYLLLAQSILVPLQQLMHDDPPLPTKQEGSIEAKRHEAIEALSQVINLTEGWSNPKLRHIALANRAGVLASLNRLDDAERDCDSVLTQDQHHDTALRNKGQILLRRGDKERAVQYLERIRGEAEKKSASLPLASLYMSLEQFPRVIQVLTPLWESSSHEHDKIIAASMLLTAHFRAGNLTKVAQIESELLQEWPDDPDTLSALSSLRVLEGNDAEAVILLECCLANSQGNLHDWAALQLAQLYYKIGNFTKAAETYQSIVNTAVDGIELREYLYSLYRSERLQEALSIASSLRGSGQPIPVISEIEASILERTSDWNGAATLLSQLQEIEPQKLSLHVSLVRVELNRGNAAASRAAAEEVPFEAIKNDPELLMRMAFARNKIGMPDVLKFAYQAWRIANDNADVQTSYAQLFPELNDDENAIIGVGPSIVDMECSVRLIRNEQTLTLTLTNEATSNDAGGEIGPTHVYTPKLLGLRVGDEVTLRSDAFGTTKYTVSEILSKYVSAFQEIIKRIETGQLYTPNMFVGNITDPAFLPNFLSSLDALRVRGEAVRTAYIENKIPLCVIADVLRKTQFEVWFALVNSRGGRVNAGSNDPQDEAKQKALLSEANALVLDANTLFTIQYLGLGAQVSQAFEKLLVSQAILDALNRYLDDSWRLKPHHTLWSAGDHYVHQEVSANEIAVQRDFVKGVIKFTQSYTQVLPSGDLLGFNKELAKALGHTAATTIELAQAQAVPLYTDDLVLRWYAQNDRQIKGVWTQVVLERMQQQGIITEDQYNVAVEKLVTGNYFIVKVNAKLFKWMLERDKFKTTSQLVRVSEALAGYYMDGNLAISITADVIKWLWIQPSLLQTKQSVLDVMMSSLISGRNRLMVIVGVKRELDKIMSLLPLQKHEIFVSINAWAMLKIL